VERWRSPDGFYFARLFWKRVTILIMVRPAKASSQTTKRVQMDMPEKSVARLRALQELTEAASYAEVVKNALRLYEVLVQEVDNGGEVLIRRGDKTERLTIFSA